VAVRRGEEWTRQVGGMVGAYGFHIGTGALGVWLMMRAVA